MDIEKFILDTLEGVGSFDFETAIKYVAVGFVVLWFVIVMWVWSDARERFGNNLLGGLCALLVAIFNLFGLIIYLILRPKSTKEELYWSDLERRYLKYETAELGDCPQCGFELRPGFNICPNCAQLINQECTGCEVMINLDWAFCPYCGNENVAVGENSTTTAEKRQQINESISKATDAAVKKVMNKEQMNFSKARNEPRVDTNSQIGETKLTNENGTTNDSEVKEIKENKKLAVVKAVKSKATQKSRNAVDQSMKFSAKIGNRVIKSVVGFGGKVDSVLSGVKAKGTALLRRDSKRTGDNTKSDFADNTQNNSAIKNDSKNTQQHDKQVKIDDNNVVVRPN